jgi:hypothetical protein
MVRVIFWAFVLVIISALYRVVFNAWCLRRLLGLKEQHAHYLQAAMDKKAGWDFTEKESEIRELFQRAGISDRTFTSIEPVGYGHVQPRHASMFDNTSTLNQEIQMHVINSFHVAIGVYKKRRRDALNPLLWVETLLNLPASAVTYLGVKKDSVWARLSNVIVWLCTVIGFLIELPAFSDLQAGISAKLLELRHLFGL